MTDNTPKSTIVTIADSRYFLPVFILVLSLKYHKVNAYIKILGIQLTQNEKEFFTQFPNVEVFDANMNNQRSVVTRKAEAILLAKNDDVKTISLLDGDCIVNGDITQYLTKEIQGISTRWKDSKEDGMIYTQRGIYKNNDAEYGSIPASILKVWQKDVGEREKSRLNNTVASGNITINKNHLDFVETWHEQMMKVLPKKKIKIAHDYSSDAYFQMDESV
ncbi:MAG: hypothetical protein SVM86_02020 [Candidatus Cloacimonadota bacterium]|nr:hypothetical protein [Candidatus Cloacimonadota bacterium]